MTASAEWLSPWYAVDDAASREAFAKQLRREICDRHVLFGEAVTLIARRQDTDDVLFRLADGRVAEVHLTWRQSTETDPRWPGTAIFASLEHWRNESMVPLRAWLDKTFGPDDSDD